MYKNTFLLIKNTIRKKPDNSNLNFKIFNLRKLIFFLFIFFIILLIINTILIEIKKPGNNLNKFIKKIIFHEMFLYKEDEKKNDSNKKLIQICMSLDNKIIFPTLISMTSALDNNNKSNNILVYNLLLSYNFNKTNIEIFESLKHNYNVLINYYIIPHIFKNFKRWHSGTYCHYYKILIPMIFSNLKRIIYLDGDTLIFTDLLEMYNLPFHNNYILGSQATSLHILKKFKIKAKYLINAGVILFNIEEIRNSNKDIELLYFSMKNSKNLILPEQDSINVIYSPKIGLLPFKYGLRLIDSINTYKKYFEKNYIKKFKLTEVIDGIMKPGIIHLVFCVRKVWHKTSKSVFKNDTICKIYQEKFYYYAKKTNYYSKIYELYMK